MKNLNPANERIKRKYFTYLKEAKRNSEQTIDAAVKALNRFEVYTGFRDFKSFHVNHAIAFKQHLAEQNGQRSSQPLSKSTLHATLTQLKRFFQWLAREPGYTSRIKYTDADFFNLSSKDTRIATAKRQKKIPTIEQVKQVIAKMPAGTDIERRDRALVAFTLATAARVKAIASMKLKHIDLAYSCVYQDAREVNTKFSKTFTTYFFPVGDDVLQIVSDWVRFLREEKLWGDDDPVFPATLIAMGDTKNFVAAGLSRAHWRTTSPIRKIFREAFTAAGLPYFNPHSFRDTLTHLGMENYGTGEQFKALSQNLGHESVLTTFISYGEIDCQRQGEIIQDLAKPKKSLRTDADEIADAVIKRLNIKSVGI